MSDEQKPRGLLCQLTPEQRARIAQYNGEEAHGDPSYALPQVLAVKPSAVGRALDNARNRLLRMAH